MNHNLKLQRLRYNVVFQKVDRVISLDRSVFI